MGRGEGAGGKGRSTVSVAELARHNKVGDAWISIYGKVYDISTWTDHPGGRVILSAAGQDATDTYKAFHSLRADGMLKKELESRIVGDLEEPAAAGSAASSKQGATAPKSYVNVPFEEGYRELYKKIKERKLMEASLPYYAWKIASNLGILGTAAYLTVTTDSFALKMLGAFLVALFWQQCGWLAHDFAHHQVFKNRLYNDMVVLFVGNLCQAFSVDWWKNKHNTHHAIPNLHESAPEAHDGDPDIDTLPFLAWSKTLIQKTLPGGANNTAFSRFCVRYQAFLYFPILFFARITWALQSLSYAFNIELGFFGSEQTKQKEAAEILKNKVEDAKALGALRYPIAERILLVAHYSLYFYLTFGPWNGPLVGAAFFFVSQTFSGLLLALAFGVGHNGMDVFDADKRPGFAELQVRTTRNVDDVWLNGWFMGGLHYQVEHHLFPMVPRHNLRLIKPEVEALCKKHNVPYRCTGLWEGNKEVLAYLMDVTNTLSEFPAM